MRPNAHADADHQHAIARDRPALASCRQIVSLMIVVTNSKHREHGRTWSSRQPATST